MKSCKLQLHHHHHQACMKPVAGGSVPGAGALRNDCPWCCFHISLHLKILHLSVHDQSLNMWMKFWWEKQRTHLNWTAVFCIFYSGFRHHKWSRHAILQWFAESNSRRIHFCALDTALYAGTGKWIHAEAFFPGGQPWVNHFISLCFWGFFCFFFNCFKITLIIPECILLCKDYNILDKAKICFISFNPLFLATFWNDFI